MSGFVRLEKDSTLAMALASGESVGAAAEQAGVTDRTVRRKLSDPEFRRQVADLRGELMSRALDRMTDNMTRAADVLAGLLDEQNPAVRLRAARSLLTLGLRLRDSIDLNNRIRDLEDELARKTGGVS
jgi:F420-0:gamma-glutamyl ligase